MKRIILGSGSPRRRELLANIVPAYEVDQADADETIAPGTMPTDAVKHLSYVKAKAVFEKQNDKEHIAVIGADTVVFIDNQILGKPHSREECIAMLRHLSGRVHTVCTGVTVMTKEMHHTFCEITEVCFYELSEEEILWYASLEEPYDKAGAYGIQGEGAYLVKEIRGDYFNVMGLPIAKLGRKLHELNLLPPLTSNER